MQSIANNGHEEVEAVIDIDMIQEEKRKGSQDVTKANIVKFNSPNDQRFVGFLSYFGWFIFNRWPR